MDGLEATQRIKATAFGSQTKIVALTAHALEDERQVMLDGGCDDFIRKPYNDSEIYNTLVKHLGVNFIYDDEKPSVTKTKLKLKPDDLKTIPFKLRQELLMVTELLDEKGCAGVIKKITAINREVGDPLLNMVKNLQFQELLTILENIEPKDLS